MISRRDTLKMIAAGAGITLAPGALAARDEGLVPLKTLAGAKGMRFGNAIGLLGDERRSKRFRDPAYRDLMARECNMIVAENETKWQAVQPQQGKFDFAAADEMFAWARKEGMSIRGHTIMWQSTRWLPDWVNQMEMGTQPAKRAESVLRAHVQAVCTHLGKNVISHDVINEAVAPGDGKLIENALSKHLGGAAAQIDLAFRLTRQYAPGAQLVYNDYMGPSKGSAAHRAGVLKLLGELKSRGTPVDALGLQSHIGVHDAMSGSAGREVAREWRKFLDEVTGMGYDLLVSEFDVSDKGMAADIATRDAATAALARDYLDVTLSYPTCRDFLLWGLADHVSWLQDWEESKRADGLPQRPTPYDSALRAKPMRASIAAVLKSMPVRKG